MVLRRMGRGVGDRLRRHRAHLFPVAALLALSGLLVSLHVVQFTSLSTIDELVHVDLLVKSSQLERPEQGGKVGEVAMREQACRGIERDQQLPPCDAEELDPTFFTDFGDATASSRFPVYHFVTGLTARGVQALPGLGSIVTAARLLGALWLAGALALTWFLMAELSVPSRQRWPALVLLATTPVVLHMSSIVNADATLMATGTAVLLTVLLWERGRLHWALAGSVVLAAVVTEETTFVAVGAAGVYLVARLAQRLADGGWKRSSVLRSLGGERRLLAAVGALAVGSVLLVAVVMPAARGLLTTSSRAPSPPVTEEAREAQPPKTEYTRGIEGASAEQVAGEVGALVTPVQRPPMGRFLEGWGTDLLVEVTHWLLVGALAVALLAGRVDPRLGPLAFGCLVAMLVTGPLVVIDNARAGVFHAVPPRFGLPVLPALFAFLAAGLHRRSALVVVSLLAVTSFGYVTGQLVA